MAKMTLLDIVQNILSAMDSDEVNSISDTVESLQVAYVVKETYEEQFNGIELPHSKTLITVDGISNILSPNYMKVHTDLKNFEWIKYKNDRNQGRFENVYFVTPEEFLEVALTYTVASGDVVLTKDPSSTIEYYVKNNRAPTRYTSFDNNHLAFDSYDSLYDSTLQSSKTMAFGTKTSSFLLENTYIPGLPETLFPLLLSEAKATCFINQKQISSSKEEQRARRQRIRMQNDQFKSKSQQGRAIYPGPNYARNK